MELTIEQQIFEQVKAAKKVLIALPQQPDADAVSSGLAVFLFLRKLEKETEIVCSGTVPEGLKFLPFAEAIKPQLQSRKSLVVTLDTSVKPLEEISYQVGQAGVNIFLKPKDQMFAPEDISIATDKFPLDLVFLLGCKSLENLGKIFEQNADLFFETPKINIDHQSDNTLFGNINLVEIAATSIAEILAGLFGKFETQMVEADIATCLLAGIIAKTNSFQRAQTTPQAFLTASELIALGGRQQEVVRHIYKTKSLPLLKLWGRALARLKADEERSVSYSILSLLDFEKAGAENIETKTVIKELLENLSVQNLVALMSELPEGGSNLLLAARSQEDLDKIFGNFGAEGQSLPLHMPFYKLAAANLPAGSFKNIEEKFLEAIKKL